MTLPRSTTRSSSRGRSVPPPATRKKSNPLPVQKIYTQGRRGNVTTTTHHHGGKPPQHATRRRSQSQTRQDVESSSSRRRSSSSSPQKTYRRKEMDHSVSSAPQQFSKKATVDKAFPVSEQDALKHHVRITRRIVEELSRPQGYERRIATITTACETFDHNDESLHNIELYHGAAHALAKLLGSFSVNDDELRMLGSALEMVFRGSPKSVQAAYERIGASLPAHLLRLLERCESGRVKNATISILNIWRILLYTSRSPALRPSLCRLNGLFVALTRVSTRTAQVDCRIAKIRFLANLANCENNKVLLYKQAGIVESVLRTAHFDSDEDIRHHAAVTLTELASSAANQRSMAQNEQLLATLVKMILVEENDATREAVITAIQNLAFAKENRMHLVTFKDGIVLEALRKSLLAEDKDPKARRRAAGALTNLASDETCETIGNHKSLLDTLAIAATKDPNREVQTRAALALTKVANGITVHMDCHAALLDALVVASLSPAENSIAAVFRVKAREPENREALARHPGVLDTLSDVCMSDVSTIADRDNAVRAIMHLVNEDKNRVVLCTRRIIEALVSIAASKDRDMADARDSAIRAMERLATEFSNRALMARQPGLLVVVAQAVEREAGWEEQGKKTEHGFLAKPLLMSLLVAM